MLLKATPGPRTPGGNLTVVHEAIHTGTVPPGITGAAPGTVQDIANTLFAGSSAPFPGTAAHRPASSGSSTALANPHNTETSCPGHASLLPP